MLVSAIYSKSRCSCILLHFSPSSMSLPPPPTPSHPSRPSQSTELSSPCYRAASTNIDFTHGRVYISVLLFPFLPSSPPDTKIFFRGLLRCPNQRQRILGSKKASTKFLGIVLTLVSVLDPIPSAGTFAPHSEGLASLNLWQSYG